MSEKSKTDKALKLLKDAYAVKTPEDSIKYYKDFSKVYDDTYVEGMSYVYHKYVAKELLSYFKGNGPICDVGCGTGLIGCLLYTSPSPRDGLLSRMPSSA